MHATVFALNRRYLVREKKQREQYKARERERCKESEGKVIEWDRLRGKCVCVCVRERENARNLEGKKHMMRENPTDREIEKNEGKRIQERELGKR